jgi:hypothetical protein
MPYWWWSSWLWEFLGLVLIGAGFVVAAIVLTNRSQRGRAPTSPLVTGDTTLPVQINFSSIRIGGDLAGLLVVIGVIVALLPLLWGFYALVAIGAVVVAVALFAWHRYR